MVQEGREIAKQEGKADMNDRKEEITSSEPPERGGAICTKRTPGIPTGGYQPVGCHANFVNKQ